MNLEQLGMSAPERVGPYLLEGRLGAGGMGSVWRAWDERLRRPVAIKQILPERLANPGARNRFRREAAAGARLNHPAIVHIYDILETADGDWIVMELVEGRTLASLLKHGPLELARAVRLGREIAKGLGKAHAQGILHRDLKAANVMVTPADHAKILDFGLAKLLNSDSFEGVTLGGAVLGTPHAMSPEQMMGLPLDPRSDLFSFGSLLYEMLTGIAPFQTRSVMTTITRVCSHRQIAVRQLQPDVPAELSELVDWLLEKEPQHRPESAREVAAVLNALLARLVRERTGETRPVIVVRPHAPQVDGAPEDEDTLPMAPPLAAGEKRQVTAVPVFPAGGELDAPGKTPRPSGPLVGREGELKVLLQRWTLVQAGESQVVLISGEAGIGKSRLVGALREELAADAIRWLTCYGAAHARSSPFQAVIDFLRRNWLRPAASPADELTLLEALLLDYGLPSDDLPFLAGLLSLPPPDGTAPLPASPETQRQRTLEALVNFFLQAVGEEPAVVAIEDLHWLDPSSLEMIGALLDAIGDVSLLLILTFRSELELPWRHRSGWPQLHLSRLTDQNALEMIDRVAGDRRLPPEVKRQIAAKSDGVPLYLEELTKGLLESGEEPEAVGIPDRLRDSLTARLDRLGRAREVAQLAAVIGRSFSFELLAAVSSLDRAALRKELDRLVRAELLSRRGTGDRGVYLFKHALLQDTACELLLPRDLERLHLEVAEALESRFPETVAGQPERLAHHYTQARRPEKAIGHWLRAGRNAAQRYANQEAREHFHNGLRAAETLPEGPERDRLELALWIGLAPTVIVSRGHSDAEAEALFDRALVLGQRLGEMPDELRSLLWSFYAWRGDLHRARSIAAERLRAAAARRDPEGLIFGLQEMATVKAHLGRPASALCALKRARELLAGMEGAFPLQISGWDAECQNLCQTARALCEAGRPDRALDVAGQALRRAEGMGCPFATGLALQSLSLLHHARREYPEALEVAGRMRDLCEKQGFASLAAHGVFLAGLAGARLSCPEEAVVLVGEAIQALDLLRREHRQELGLPELLGRLAEVCVDCGMASEARWLLDDAQEIAARTGERLGVSELYRLQGVLSLATARGEAEAFFQTACGTARAAGSLWLELRATAALAGLWKEDGRKDEARGLLDGVLGRFREGWETADLKAAAGLLKTY
ncbi:MAG TPA: protein kinase [Thermoanaerobaculia bacterium]